MSKIVITGGAGFIGSQLGHYLEKEGNEIILVDDMSFGYEDNLSIDGKKIGTFVNMDVRSKEIFSILNGVDYVFHFAGISSLPVCQTRPRYAIDVNVAGTANVLEACRVNNVKRIVFASTSAIYENNKTYPSKESDITSPDLIYSMSKLQAEMLCKSYFENYGVETVILRYYNVYGPHQDYRRKSPPFVGYVLRELLAENRPILHSDGEQKRDYVYVDDVNRLNKMCIDWWSGHTAYKIPGKIFNVSSNSCHSVNEIYEILASSLSSDVKPIFKSGSDFWNKYDDLFNGYYPLSRKRIEKEVNKYTLGCNEKAKNIFGWEPSVDIETGMKRVVDYIKNDKKRSNND